MWFFSFFFSQRAPGYLSGYTSTKLEDMMKTQAPIHTVLRPPHIVFANTIIITANHPQPIIVHHHLMLVSWREIRAVRCLGPRHTVRRVLTS